MIYLDYNASTPIDPTVAAAMRPFLDDPTLSPDEIEKMQQAWSKAVLLQVVLWSYPYVKEGDF